MKSIPKIVGVTASVGALLAIAACGSDSGHSSGDPVKIAFLTITQANPYSNATFDGLDKYATEHDAEVVQFDANFDSAKQQQQCTDALSTGEYGLIVTIPVTTSNLKGCFEDAIDQGVAVVNTDFPLGPDPASGEPQIEGQAASILDPAATRGEWMFELIKGACADKPDCKVGILTGNLSDPYGKAATDVVQKKAKESGNIEIVTVRQGGYMEGPAMTETTDLLQAVPDIDVISSTSDPMTLGAEKAVQEAGKTGQVTLIGGCYSAESVEAIKSGRWYGTFVALPGTEGALAGEYGLAAARGDNKEIGVSPTERSGKSAIITAENINDYGDLQPEW